MALDTATTSMTPVTTLKQQNFLRVGAFRHLQVMTLPEGGTDASSDQDKKGSVPGGWSPIDDLQDERVLQIAEYTLDHISNSTEPYSFASTVESGEYNYEITQGEEQVVAGLNYNLTIYVSNMILCGESTCLGGFTVEVWDQFGDLSITKWGPELACLVDELLDDDGGEDEGESSEPTVGAYFPIENLTSTEVVDAATFAVDHLEDASVTYSFVDALLPGIMLDILVIRGFEQVVAGTNYNLTIVLNDNDTNCLGAFNAIVYEQLDGTMMMSEWGSELSCSQADAIGKRSRHRHNRLLVATNCFTP